MQDILNFALANWGDVVAVLVFVLGLLKGVGWLRFVLNVCDYAFRQAEATGVLNGLQRFQKAEPYLLAFFDAYEQKKGASPGPLAQGIAQFVAAKKAAAEKSAMPIQAKVAAAANPPSPSASVSAGPTSA